MGESNVVASLEAPITITIPKDKINQLKKDLQEIRDSLEYVVKQMADLGKVIDKNFKSTGKHLKIQNTQIGTLVQGEKKRKEEGKKNEEGAKRTAKVYGDWADKLAQVRVIIGLIKFSLMQLAKLVLIPSGFFTALTFMAQRINGATTEMINLSEAVGWSVNDMRALGMEAKSLGFTFEHVNSLAEELNNKMGGESGGFIENNLREGLHSLNIEAERLQKLKPQEQFAAIMNAGAKLYKKGKVQELASAYDKIFGQEGNRLLTSFTKKMDENNQSFDEFLSNARKYVGISAAAQQGAKIFTSSFNVITESIKTFSAELFGLMGKRLEPFFNTFTGFFSDLNSKGGKLLSDLADIMADAFISGAEAIINAIAWLVKHQEELKAGIIGLVNVLKSMFKIGVEVGKLLATFIPVITSVTNLALDLVKVITRFASSDFGRTLIMWVSSGALLAFTLGKVGSALLSMFLVLDNFLVSGGIAKLITLIGASFNVASVAFMGSIKVMIAGLASLQAAWLPITAAVLAALAAYMAWDDYQNSKKTIEEQTKRGDAFEKRTQEMNRLRLQNIDRIRRGEAPVAPSSWSNSMDKSITKTENNNIHNIINVNSPEVSKEIQNQIKLGRIS